MGAGKTVQSRLPNPNLPICCTDIRCFRPRSVHDFCFRLLRCHGLTIHHCGRHHDAYAQIQNYIRAAYAYCNTTHQSYRRSQSSGSCQHGRDLIPKPSKPVAEQGMPDNLYGMTEATVCTSQKLSGNKIDATCIGRAVDGLEVCLLADGCAEEIPKVEVGEICVAGPQLFRGYISTKPDAKSPECRRNGQMYYRTGDLGRMETCRTGEKTIRYLGRRDGQVKVHGIRVDLMM